MLGEPRPRRLKKTKASGFNIRGNQLFLGGLLTTHRIDIWIGFLFDFCWLRGSVLMFLCMLRASAFICHVCLFLVGIYGVKPSKSRAVLCAARGNVLLCSGCCWLAHGRIMMMNILRVQEDRRLTASQRSLSYVIVDDICERTYMEKRMQGTLCSADEFNKGNWLLRGFSRRGICFTVAWYGHCGIVGLLRADGIFEANNYGVQRQSNYASILTCFTRSFWANDLFYYFILVKLHFWCYIYTSLYTDRGVVILGTFHQCIFNVFVWA